MRGIVVEVNPTSNLLIGDMLDLRNHPVLRLFPVQPDSPLLPVPIAIGSDDPITFSTSLLREYGYLFRAACTAGYTERVVLDWLERIRRTSMDARFTLPWKPDGRTMAWDILRSLDHHLYVPRCHTRMRKKHLSEEHQRWTRRTLELGRKAEARPPGGPVHES